MGCTKCIYEKISRLTAQPGQKHDHRCGFILMKWMRNGGHITTDSSQNATAQNHNIYIHNIVSIIYIILLYFLVLNSTRATYALRAACHLVEWPRHHDSASSVNGRRAKGIINTTQVQLLDISIRQPARDDF